MDLLLGKIMLNIMHNSSRDCGPSFQALCVTYVYHIISLCVSTGSQHLLQPVVHRVRRPHAAAETVDFGHRPHTLL